LIKGLVDDIHTVSDAQLIEVMRFYAERMKMIVEPTGCLSLAAAVQASESLKGKKVGLIISGGNIDMARFSQLMTAYP
jgi:threonine dehydratase